MMRVPSQYHRHHRRAALIMAVLVCLTLVTVLAGVWMQLLAVERRHVRNQQGAMQAELLAEAGMARAVRALQTDAAYPGEVWQPSAEALGAKLPAKVSISVASVADAPRARAISVAAAFPEVGSQRALRSIQQTIHLPAEEPKP